MESIQLAVLLATSRPIGAWVTATEAWTWTGDPFGHGRSLAWRDTRYSPGLSASELTLDECEAVREWSTIVDTHWGTRIDVAIRRFLSAANARTDRADRLVDSVIVWENLFGTSQGETQLRVSAAMAWLLANDPAEGRTYSGS